MCAGLGGPARFLAARYGCAVVALERHAGRAAGAADLTRRVGLAGRMRVVRADALAPPFADASFDVVMSQEAFLHIADKPALLAGCHRLLAAGGRLVFTDWTATPALGPADRELMWRGIAAQGLLSADDYRHQLAAAGFRSVESEDLTAQWAEILAGRLRMYQGLREDARRATGADPHADYVKFYEAFVRLVQERRLGGARFVAVK
jgi:SAM-dependent methyltransferase